MIRFSSETRQETPRLDIIFSSRGQELETPIGLKTHKIGEAVEKKKRTKSN